MSTMPSSSDTSNKRKCLTELQDEPPAKRKDPNVANSSINTTASKSSAKHCAVCNGYYTSEKSHKGLCTEQEVTCRYPASDPTGPTENVVLHRQDGLFQCIRCSKRLKKVQNMKDHARQCYKISRDAHGTDETEPEPRSSVTTVSGPSPLSHVSTSSALSHTASSIDVRSSAMQESVAIAAGDSRTNSKTDEAVLETPSIVRVTPSSTSLTNRTLAHFESTNCGREGPDTGHDGITCPSSDVAGPNQYEALIRPDEHSVTDDALLLRTPYIVNRNHMALICIQCKHAVNPNSASTHVKQMHSYCKLPKTFSTELNAKYPGLATEKIHPGEVIRPIFGLAVPPEKYVICSRCLRGYVNVLSWRSHICEKADINLNGRPPHFFSLVQTFFREPRLCYFPVEFPVGSTTDSTNDFELFMSQSPQIDTADDEVIDAPDYRELDQFLLKEGWLAHVAGFSRSELSSLTHLPQQDENLAPVAHEVLLLMSKIQSIIGRAGIYVRRLLGKRPSHSHDDVRTIHHRDLQHESMKGYSLIVSCLVYFVMRCHRGWTCDYKMELTSDQHDACASLDHVLHAARGDLPVIDDETSWSLGEQDLYSGLELGDDEGQDSDDEVYEDAESFSAEDSHPVESGETAYDEAVENATQASILKVLISLYTQLPSGKDDKFFSPILRFAVLFSLGKTGQWLSPRRITHVLAVLLFCGREVMMALMHRQLLKDGTIRYSHAYEEIAAFLDEDREGPIPAMYLITRYLNRFAAEQEGGLRFTALDFSGDNVIVAGHVLYLRDIRYFVETLITEIKDQFRTTLFFGLDVIDMNWSPGAVHEEPRNISIRYSCFRDPKNTFSNHKEDLLQIILTHPLIRGHFHYINQHGQLTWKTGPCFAYMHHCHEVEMKLFSGAQTSVGETARGTEIASHLIENVSGGTIRNVLVIFQYFSMMGTYNKIGHAAGQSMNMMRVPHPEIGRLWMLYITFVRPVISIWQTYFHGRKAAARAQNRLFFGLHRLVTSSELSKSLSYHTGRLLNVKISISLWRHIVTWFLNHDSVGHIAISNRSALAFQMGHSEEAHTLYAADGRLPAKIDFHVFYQTMRASGIWHELVSFESNLLQDLNHRTRKLPAVPKQNDHKADDSATAMLRLSPVPVASITEAVKKALIPEIVDILRQTRANDLAALLDAVGINVQSPGSLTHPQPVTHILHPSRLQDLRRFLADDTAAFKHTQQALATELIASRDPSILLIGPTGSGKTLPLFLSIALYDGGKSTVLILPLLAMHDEYKARARKHGLTCETWLNSHSSPSAQLILVAVESCVWDELKVHIMTLIRLGRLARLVVDEAHLLLKHASFRPCVDMLECFGQMPTSILLMTATCPQNLEKRLFDKLGRQIYQVLRRGTDRPEIAQKMVAIRSDDMESVVASNISLITRQFNAPDRALLFCWSHDECDRMAKLLSWKPYYASISLEERSEYMKLWNDGEIPGLASTSMLNCCLDHPSVRAVFHLGPPRDAVDYFQAIGRAARKGGIGRAIVYFNPNRLKKFTGDDLYGASVIYDMLRDNGTCRRLRPAIFLDGFAVPCAMLPSAQLCDVCEAEAMRDPPEKGPLRFPGHLLPSFKQPTDVSTVAVIPAPSSASAHATTNHHCKFLNSTPAHPINQPAPSATFGNHFAGAQAVLKQMTPTHSEQQGLKFRMACQGLAGSCVYCWSQGLEHHTHSLSNCELNRTNEAHREWKFWKRYFKFPAGCCFFCGFPLKMTYPSDSRQNLPVHDHPTDQTCHWINIFKPLSFIVLRDAQLTQHILQPVLHCGNGRRFDASDFSGYAKWLCELGEGGLLNLMGVFLRICDFRGIPQLPIVN